MNPLRYILVTTAILCCASLINSQFVGDKSNKRNYGYNAGTHFRNEFRGDNGVIDGEYGFRTPDGCMHVVKYQASNSEYRVMGTEKRDCGKKPMKRLHVVTPIVKQLQKTTPTSTTTTTTTTTTRKPTTTTPRPSTTTRTIIATTTTRKPSSPRPTADPFRNSGKSLLESVKPPPNMKRPAILSPSDPEPTYSFGFEAPGHGHTQAGLPGGVKKGEYYWDSPDGWRRIVTYEANENGFFPKLKRVRIPKPTEKPILVREGKDLLTEDEEGLGKQLSAGPAELKAPVSNGCPYFFYTNTRINYHWERCILNGTRVGEYGRLADDGFNHRVKYYADSTGFHPSLSKIPLTPEQKVAVAEITEGAFIIPKIEEEKQETERRIQDWLSKNQNKIDTPL